jgi:photosystem II biogenesis protein Psp29
MATEATQQVGHHSLEEVKGWLSNRGEGAPAPISGLLQGVQRSDFHYSRLVAVGLLSLLQQAKGADAMDPQALRAAAHDIGEAMGLMKERVDKDLSLYATNIEKMSQAVELMEETIAAERRRRERAEAEGSSPAEPEGVNAD